MTGVYWKSSQNSINKSSDDLSEMDKRITNIEVGK